MQKAKNKIQSQLQISNIEHSIVNGKYSIEHFRIVTVHGANVFHFLTLCRGDVAHGGGGVVNL